LITGIIGAATVVGAFLTGWPSIIAVILILRTSFAFAVFEEILAITQGGPGDATWVAAWYSYKITFAPPNNFGMGSASAFILTLMIAAIALPAYQAYLQR
jgi:ABC-type sugar transport system permease subunit